MAREYKSSDRRLAVFFERSRDSWKERSLAAKKKIRYQVNRIRFLEKSKERLRKELEELKRRVAEAPKDAPDVAPKSTPRAYGKKKQKKR